MNNLMNIKFPSTNLHLKTARASKKSLKVVITGASQGLGKAMTNKFIESGDKVFVISRNASDIDKMVNAHKNIYGHPADVGNSKHIEPLFDKIQVAFDGEVDLFLNCAAQSGGYGVMDELDDNKISSIIQTNLLGTSLCCKYAYDIMKGQESGGAIFNFLGNGSSGHSTPHYAIYGSTKAAIKQLTHSLQREWSESTVDLHLISPGLMITDLLMENLSKETFEFIRNMCSTPEIVAHHIVPRMRSTYYSARDDHTIKFLTVMKIMYKMMSQNFVQ